jgi:hypothetical protein
MSSSSSSSSKTWSMYAVAAIGLSGCVTMSGEDEEEMMLRVSLEGYSIETVEVVERGTLGELDDTMRPQPNGLTGVIFTDTSSGETLAEGWTTMPTPMPPDDLQAGSELEKMPASELYVVVPVPEHDAVLTLSVPTEAGPIILTTSFDTDALWAR